MKINKWGIISISTIVILLIALLTSVFIYKRQVNLEKDKYNTLIEQNNKQIDYLKKKNINIENSYKEKLKDNENQAKHTISANADPKQEENQKFNKLTYKLMNNFYSFTPKNYSSRKNEVKGKISNDLYNNLYPTSKTSTNNGGTTSKFESLQLFSNTDPGITKSGLAIVKYKVKSGSNHYQEHSHMWKVDYDYNKDIITGLTDMGTTQNIGGN